MSSGARAIIRIDGQRPGLERHLILDEGRQNVPVAAGNFGRDLHYIRGAVSGNARTLMDIGTVLHTVVRCVYLWENRRDGRRAVAATKVD